MLNCNPQGVIKVIENLGTVVMFVAMGFGRQDIHRFTKISSRDIVKH